MYLSSLHLQNWRTYADSTFTFNEPSAKRSVVLVGAMNGVGKTSFLISLYLGLFGRYGLRHCEGFGSFAEGDVKSYREAVSKFRRNCADPDEPSIIDLTFSPSWRDTDEEEVRVVRRWFFSGRNEPKQGDSFEEADVYVGGRLQKQTALDKDPLIVAHERIEKNLFRADVAPAFFFDGEQAQKLIETAGEKGLKKAVEVMFGTKVIGEVAATMRDYMNGARQNTGGKRRATEQQAALGEKLTERESLNDQINKKQSTLTHLEADKEGKEEERVRLHEELARMGGVASSNAAQLQAKYVQAEKEQADAEKALADAVKQLGLALGVFRLGPAIRNRLKAEEAREAWEGLRKGTIDNMERVLAAALPEPDPILGELPTETIGKLRQRFADALERIYNPPPSNCAEEYILGHVKGEARTKLLSRLAQAQAVECSRVKAAAKRLRDARELVEDTKRDMERVENLPQATKEVKQRLDELNSQIQESIRHIGALENEMKAIKAKLHETNKQIGEIQEELARLGPEQRRIAIAERVCRALEALQEQLAPTTTQRLETFVTKHFISIADRRFRNSEIYLRPGEPPQIRFKDGRPPLLLEVNSGFERRAFGIAFTLALADITRRRVPLVVDTPIGNADSEYRPRTLKALAGFDLDQIIILTHDEEVTPNLIAQIEPQISQKFLVEYNEAQNLSTVQPDCFFKFLS